MFEEEIARATQGACTWEAPKHIDFQEVEADGLIHVVQGRQLATLPPPWNLIDGDEVVLEIKMSGDHLDAEQWYKALLRRQAREVVRCREAKKANKDSWIGHQALWMVSGYVPDWIKGVYGVTLITEGVYRISGHSFTAFWIAANELPLLEELIPFLVTRTGSSLREFVGWVAQLKSDPTWVLRMLRVYKMTISNEELMNWFKPEDEEDARYQSQLLLTFMEVLAPEAKQELYNKAGLDHLESLYRLRLGRPLNEQEKVTVATRLASSSTERLQQLAFEKSPEELIAWLSDPEAT